MEAIKKNNGDNVKTTDSTEATVEAYQTATAHGNAVVSDATKQTTIKYGPGQAILSPVGAALESIVHVPISNPPQLSTASELQALLIKFDTSDAWITGVALYYDNKQIFTYKTNETQDFYLTFTSTESSNYAYKVPTGISVALNLKFRTSSSLGVTLRSVALVYKAA